MRSDIGGSALWFRRGESLWVVWYSFHQRAQTSLFLTSPCPILKIQPSTVLLSSTAPFTLRAFCPCWFENRIQINLWHYHLVNPIIKAEKKLSEWSEESIFEHLWFLENWVNSIHGWRSITSVSEVKNELQSSSSLCCCFCPTLSHCGPKLSNLRDKICEKFSKVDPKFFNAKVGLNSELYQGHLW